MPDPIPPSRNAPPGVALVVTLMMMSVLVMMVVGLAGVMRNEQAAARNLTYQVLAEQMADLGARRGMAAVLAGNLNNQPAITGPGWMRSGSTFSSLFSVGASGDNKNLEEIGTNSMILGLPDNVRGEIRVGWSNLVPPNNPANRPVGRFAFWVDDEGTKVNLNSVGSNNTNLFLPLLTAFPVSADYIFVDPATGTTNSASALRAAGLAGRSNPFVTTESLKDTNVTGLNKSNNSIGPTVFRRAKGHITAWSSNVDLTPWGAQKLNLADPAVTTAQIKAMLMTNVWTNFFGAGLGLSYKYGGGIPAATNPGNFGDYVMDQIVANIQAARGQWAVPSTNTNIFLANNPRRHRQGLPTNALGWSNNAPFLNEVAVSVGYTVTGTNVVCRFVVASEIWNPWPVDAAGFRLEIRPRKFRFFISTVQAADPTQGQNPSVDPTVTPPPGSPAGTIILGGTDTANPGGVTGSSPFGCWIGPMMENNTSYPTTAGPTILLPTISSNSLVQREDTFVYDVNFSSDPQIQPLAVIDAYVQIDRVVLRDGSGRALDWVTLDDFAMAQNFGSANTTLPGDYGQLNFSPSYPFAAAGSIFASPTISAGFDPTQAMGLAKNDPRVRLPLQAWTTSGTTNGLINTAASFPAGLQAWYRTGPNQSTLGLPNGAPAINFAASPIPFLVPDPVPAGANQTNHPHFVAGYLPTGGFKSVAQLGSIHTGLPWRTLRLQPTPAAELAQGPPDWVLLDAFTVENPTTSRPRINLNGLPIALVGNNPGLVTNGSKLVPTRAWSVLCAMAPATYKLAGGTNTNTMMTNGVPVSLTKSNSVYTSIIGIGTNLTSVLSNPSSAAGWSTKSGWSSYRTGKSFFPSNGMALTGEILEVSGVADDPNQGEDVIEGRLRGFMDLLTTRSDTFSVWSVGQGLVVVTNAVGSPIRTNVMGEVRKQTVFQRIPQFDAAKNLSGYQFKVLYTRNHVVE